MGKTKKMETNRQILKIRARSTPRKRSALATSFFSILRLNLAVAIFLMLIVSVSAADLGIGTNTPARKLHILTSTSDGIRLESSGSDGPELEWRTGTGTHWNIDQQGSPSNLRFFTEDTNDANGVVRMTLLNAGGLNVNTLTDALRLGTSTGNYPDLILGIDTSTTGNGADIAITGRGSGGSGFLTNYIYNWGGAYYWDFGSASGPVTHMTLTNSGLGLGTTSPSQKLHVVGRIRSYDLAGAGNRCVYADASGVLYTKMTDCGTGSGGDDLGSHVATQNIQLGSNWLSGDGGNEGISVSASGNVGVGTASPTATLHVAGITRLGNYGTKPTCNANARGGLVFDTILGKPFVCDGTVWKPLDSDFDSDGITEAVDFDDTVAGDSSVVTADVRSGVTYYSSSAASRQTGIMANCANGGTGCYANGGLWYSGECGESTTITQTSCYVDTTARYLTTDLCNAAKENQCYVSTTGGYYAFGSECADSTTGTRTNCYVDTTAKYVDSNACSAGSNTGYCYMNTATLSGKDADLAAGNIKNGITVFGVTGNYAPGQAAVWRSPAGAAATPNTICAPYGGPVKTSTGDCFVCCWEPTFDNNGETYGCNGGVGHGRALCLT